VEAAVDEVVFGRYRLTEPHIIPIHDTGELDGPAVCDGAMTPQRAVDVIAQVAAALHAAHAVGLVHRDIKSKHSAEPWTYDSEDGVTSDSERILRELRQLRQQYGARLLWAGDRPAAHSEDPDFWVTVAPVYADNSGDVLAWCTNHNRDSDYCYAQDLDSGKTAHN
jgi:serine/threonine protein kinase